MFLSKLFNPYKICKAIFLHFKSKLNFLYYNRLSNNLKSVDLSKNKYKKKAVVELFWKNPNHIFRLWLVCRALSEIHYTEVIIVIWKRDLFTKIMMKWLKKAKFIEVEKSIKKQDYEKSKNILKKVKNYNDFLKLRLEDSIPSYIIYDTILKDLRHPSPVFDKEYLIKALASFLSIYNQVNKIIKHERPEIIFTSHAWKNEFCSLIFSGIKHDIPVLHITSFCEGLRIKKINNILDFKTPVDYLEYNLFSKLKYKQQNFFIENGFKELNKRQENLVNDINVRYAYSKKNKLDNFHKNLSSNKNIKVLVASHAWFDFPHSFGMKNFDNYYDFILTTYEIAKTSPNIEWYFKPHPTESWYGGFQLKDVIKDKFKNISITNDNCSTSEIINLCDVVITVHGTIALEAGICKKLIICADNNYFKNWPFVKTATSKSNYINLLNDLKRFKQNENSNYKLAAACLYGSLSSPSYSNSKPRLRFYCDSLGLNLVNKINDTLNQETTEIENEINRLSNWIENGYTSYASNQLLDLVEEEL